MLAVEQLNNTREISKAAVHKRVQSANTEHLIHGVFAIFMAMLVEAMVVFELITADIGAAIAVAFLMQIAAVYFGSYAIKYLEPYKRKSEFSMYFSKLEDVVDMDALKRDFHIVKIDEYGVLFVNKKDEQAATDWELVYKGTPTRKIERDIFAKIGDTNDGE